MPFFRGDTGDVEAVQLERFTFQGAPMFNAALPPWLMDATAKHHQEVGVFYWRAGSAFIVMDHGPVRIDVGDWIARLPDGQLMPYDPLAFCHLYEPLEAHDQED
jgi:hypothetical protein